MKFIYTIVMLLGSCNILFAQEETHPEVLAEADDITSVEETHRREFHEEGWTTEGSISSLFGHSAFNKHWLGGGTSDVSMEFNIVSGLNYEKGKFISENEVTAEYGIARDTEYKNTHKTNDRFEINSISGIKIRKSRMYFSFLLNFKTQFDRGYKYEKDEFNKNTRKEISRILSPGDIKFGPGIFWKNNKMLSINITPMAGRFTLVNKIFTKVDPLDKEALEAYEHHKYYGVEANKTSLFEFGTAVRAFYKFEILKDIFMTNTVELYSNYLEAPQNVDLNYNANLSMLIGKYFTARILFEAIYDDDAIDNIQVREGFGLGANYMF
ncbi:DUF3078 domain-containing protein [Aquimarina longa]|uniref:DUF3078 domain-containing protein n=1 Tax=Aquimarina longa TaxID=1080221 RepID=UPI000780228E|nr:DUF3078 domain-containing protein [Aquimarina longa]